MFTFRNISCSSSHFIIHHGHLKKNGWHLFMSLACVDHILQFLIKENFIILLDCYHRTLESSCKQTTMTMRMSPKKVQWEESCSCMCVINLRAFLNYCLQNNNGCWRAKLWVFRRMWTTMDESSVFPFQTESKHHINCVSPEHDLDWQTHWTDSAN